MKNRNIRLMIGDIKFSLRSVGVLKKITKYYFKKEGMMNFGHFQVEL